MGMKNRPIFVVVLGTGLVLSACAGTTGSSSRSPSAVAATPIPIGTALNECSNGSPCQCAHDSPCQFRGGTYATFGQWAFLPGLTMTIPGGWYSTEQDAGEFNVLHSRYGQGGLFFWRDMIPVDLDGNHLVDVPSTPEGLTDWFVANPNLTVTDPESVNLGRGTEAITFTFTTAPGAVNPNQDPNCPDYPPGAAVCFPLITDPVHWGGSWDTASAHAIRLYLASIGPVSSPHLLLVAVLGTVEAPSTETDPFVELQRIEAAVQPILDSLDVSKVTFN
jgi:hypothetical protein